jgi:cell division protein FtsB
MLQKILKFITNKYFLVTIFFLSWVFFFSSNDLFSEYQEKKEYREMKAKIEYLQTEIKNLQLQQKELTTDTAAIIKYARERYLMRKTNEDLFIFDTVKNQPPYNK